MKAFYFVLSIAAVAVSANAGVVVLEKHPIDWYDCSGQRDGNYIHPYDCTRFISCSGGIASERDCANCTVDAVRCPEGRLVYNATQNACDYADRTTCSASPGPSTEPAEPTTERPTEEPITETTTGRTTEEPTTERTTEEPTEGTTPPPSIVLPIEGSPCTPNDCRNIGYCHTFFRCSNDSGSWVWAEKNCGPDLIWNPHNRDGSNHIHGGNCDFYDNLQDSQKEKYGEDGKCLKCYWKAFGKCSSVYEYQERNLKYRSPQNLTCNDGLVFVESLETCQRCTKVKGDDGNPCC